MADAIQTGIATLQDAVSSVAGATNFGSAVSSLQGAGSRAVSVVGPAIDTLSNSDPTVMSNTNSAWQQNSSLASVENTDSAGQPDLDLAVSYVNQMISMYNTAYNRAKSLATPAPKAVPAPAAAAPVAVAPVAAVPVVAATPAYQEPALIGGGAVLGAVVGMRLLGGLIGGPVGLAVGAGLGYWINTKLKK